MGYSAEVMTRFLAARDDGARRYVIDVDGAPAGAVSIRYPWLLGPYVELLAILPASQGRGLGAAVLDWLAQEASRLEARNLWVCASRGNASALRFYQRHGFEETAALPDLVADGFENFTYGTGGFMILERRLTFGSNFLLDNLGRLFAALSVDFYEKHMAWIFPARNIFCRLSALK